LSEVDWAKKSKTDEKGPLKQMLLLLGIRMEDIQDEDPENWRLLLPEERKWLRTRFSQNTKGEMLPKSLYVISKRK